LRRCDRWLLGTHHDVLRQCDETEVEDPWRTMVARLDDRGIVVEGPAP